MIILISGATHAGKTALAQTLLHRYGFPYLSIDYLKMGLIRSGQTMLTPTSADEELTAYLWPIVREIIKTAIENEQNLIVEGCYIPFDREKDFSEEYRAKIRDVCLILSERYIKEKFATIKRYANVAEKRLEEVTMEHLLEEHTKTLELAKAHGANYILIEDEYKIEFEI